MTKLADIFLFPRLHGHEPLKTWDHPRAAFSHAKKNTTKKALSLPALLRDPGPKTKFDYVASQEGLGGSG